MNKYLFAAALVALVGVQLAASNTVGLEEDRETSLLLGNERLFGDFCRESHDYILNDIKTSARQTSANLYRQFFGSANEIGEEVLNVEREAVAELAKQIAQPEAPIQEAPIPESEVAALIEEGKREIQQRAGVSSIIPGVKSATSAMVSAVNSALFVRLAQARTYLSANALLQGIYNTCDKIHAYEQHLEQDLLAYKDKVATEHEDPEVQTFLSTVSLSSLRCQTTRNVVRLDGFCDLFKNGQGPFMKMLGLGGRRQ